MSRSTGIGGLGPAALAAHRTLYMFSTATAVVCLILGPRSWVTASYPLFVLAYVLVFPWSGEPASRIRYMAAIPISAAALLSGLLSLFGRALGS
jgi:hypothetical protein